MAKLVILLVILILILLIIAIFSIELRIVVSFYTSSEYLLSDSERLYKYSVVVNRIFRRDSKTPKKTKRKSKRSILKNISKFSHHLEIIDISIMGNISLSNAFLTALSVGILNSAAGFFIAFLSAHCNKVSLSRIMIRPVYSDEIEGDIFFECIVKTNLGNIITESAKHFINTHKAMKGNKKNVKPDK